VSLCARYAVKYRHATTLAGETLDPNLVLAALGAGGIREQLARLANYERETTRKYAAPFGERVSPNLLVAVHRRRDDARSMNIKPRPAANLCHVGTLMIAVGAQANPGPSTRARLCAGADLHITSGRSGTVHRV
jgi:hypothetical protein